MKSAMGQSPTMPLFKIVRRFFPMVRSHPWLMSGSFAAMFAEVGFRLLEPWPLKWVFDHVINWKGSRASTAPSTGWMSTIEPVTLLTISAVALVVIVTTRALVTYFRRVGFALLGDGALTECRRELFMHLQRLPMSFHEKNRTGDLLTRITADIGRLKEVVSTAAMPLVAHGVTVLAMAGVMLWMNWRLSLVVLAILPVFWFSVRDISGKIHATARRERQRQGDLGAVAAEAMGSIKAVQSLSMEGVHAKSFDAQNRKSLAEGVRGKRLSARLLGTAEVLIAIATATVLWFGAKLVVDGTMTPGDLIVFLSYLKTGCRPIRNMAKYTARLAKASASAERVLEILDATPTIIDRHGATEAPDSIGSIVFENVSFSYEPSHPAISDLSIEARRGEIVALVGASGAGKSTIVNLMLRLYDIDVGCIRIDGTDIRDHRVSSYRARIAVVPQDSVLFVGTVSENITMGADDVSQADVRTAAILARADTFIRALPEGYDTILGERGESLSVGQRQRIALARAAVRKTPIIILDEPTASVDAENSIAMNRAIRDLSRERICVVISHDLADVRDADRIYYLDHGRVIESGTHESLLGRRGGYWEMHGHAGSQALVDPDLEGIDALSS